MSSSVQSSPSRIGSVYGKSGLVSTLKSTLTEQQTRFVTKHNIDLDLIEDLRTFIKTKCNIEREYSNALIKLANSQSKKYPIFTDENDSEIKTIYTSWKTYLEEMDKYSKNRLSQFDQLAQICDLLKQMKNRKLQISKKSIDQHLKKMQEEVITSLAEIDKTRKLYFDDEHMAKQARDKEEKIKKRKTGLFSSFTNLQTKKEKSSAHREATDIQSTQARNDYIMALSAGNAHLDHYYNLDLPQLMHIIDDDVLDKCRGFMLSLLESEINAIQVSNECLDNAHRLIQSTSADFTNSAFLAEPQSACLREMVLYEFEPCDNDTINIISLDHNADFALKNEIQKWFTWFAKECRNLNRLSQQLIKCQSLLAEGHKTVEVSGSSNPVDIENRIDDIKQQIRKCEISKIKAKARLQVIKEAGLEVEDFESFESQITTEIKQQSLDVDINIGMPLSRTPSLRSTNMSTMSDSGRISSLDGKSDDPQTDTDHYQTPEPEMASNRSGRPESSSSDQIESPDRDSKRQSFEANAVQSWDEYDPTQVWTDEPTPTVESSIDYVVNNVTDDYNNYESVEEVNNESYDNYAPVDGSTLVGKVCQTLYPYESQNDDDLSFLENENLTVIEALDKDWVKAQNDRQMIGYVPAAYLVAVADAPIETAGYEEPIENIPIKDIEINNEITNGNHRAMSADSFVKAIYGYTATSDEEMSFSEGDIMKLLSKSDDGWWTAEKNGVIGHFPSMLVEELGDEDSSAFAESISGESEESIEESPTTPIAPPPSFAPPKPAYLTPHQVVIIQPTPEIESKPKLGDEEENEESKEVVNEEVVNDETNEVVVEINVPEVNSSGYEFNPEFTLEKPTHKSNEEGSETENIENSEISETVTKIGETIVIPVVSVEVIESTAEEISEAITHEAIVEANQYNHESSQQSVAQQNNSEGKHYNYCNEDSDYEDIK